MAVTYSLITNSVLGNMRLVVFNLTATAAEEEVGTSYHGLTKIAAILSCAKQSGATANTTLSYAENVDSSGVVSAGCIGFSGLVGAESSVVRVSVLGY